MGPGARLGPLGPAPTPSSCLKWCAGRARASMPALRLVTWTPPPGCKWGPAGRPGVSGPGSHGVAGSTVTAA